MLDVIRHDTMNRVISSVLALLLIGCNERSEETTELQTNLKSIEIYSSCTAYDKSNDTPVDAERDLRLFDGHVYHQGEEDYCFSTWLIDQPDDSPIQNAGITGGYLTFRFDNHSGELIASVTYTLDRQLTELQIKKLKAYTRGQCSDGIGEGFMQAGCKTFPVCVWPMTGDIEHHVSGL